jgi:hypothetical protein
VGKITVKDFFYTLESNKNCIKRYADIERTYSFKKLTETLNKMIYGADIKIIGWEIGYFNDYWVKLFDKPEGLTKTSNINFEGIKCNVDVKEDGDCYWLIPMKEVYVPILQCEEDN